MSVTIKSTNKIIGVSDIENFEALIQKKLPFDYCQFLLIFNGGKPEANEFFISRQQTASGVSLFYGLLENRQWGDLIYHRKMLHRRVPQNILPIASDPCGNCICLSLNSDTFGQVFFWNHELEADEGEPTTFTNLFKIGDSFNDFFGQLKQFDANQIKLKPGQVKKVWVNPNFLEEQKKKGNSR
jgi:hypothetical protein